MAKTLLMVRHGKSSWKHSGQADHERPLLKTGIERTDRMGQFLLSKGILPDLVVSSHAVRAFETAKILAGVLGYPIHEIQIERNIYYFGSDGLFDLAMALPDDKEVVMLVGHNPAMTQLANVFLEQKLDYLPTTGMVSVRIDADKWEELPVADNQVAFLATPKMLET
jgi:phosphohistidine phosphatase